MLYALMAAVAAAAAVVFLLIRGGLSTEKSRTILLLVMEREAETAELRLRKAKKAISRMGPGGELFVLDGGMDGETRAICRRFLLRTGIGQMGDPARLQKELQGAERFARDGKV